jgi:phosphinothricin acetyltransferase
MHSATNGGLAVRCARSEDAEQVVAIYNHYVATSVITFEEDAVVASEMANRILEIQAASLPWLVAEMESRIVGFAYAGKWKTRAAYKFSTEVTVYVRDGLGGWGIGSKLYGQLLPELKSGGMHTAIGGVALPNEASIRLHEKFGFKKTAHFEEVGFKFNRWVDVAYWQRRL